MRKGIESGFLTRLPSYLFSHGQAVRSIDPKQYISQNIVNLGLSYGTIKTNEHRCNQSKVAWTATSPKANGNAREPS
jgi:hypothetical protein